MRISAQLAADMKWLVAEEQWDEAAKEEARRCLRNDPAFFGHFFTVFVAAKRAGYKMFGDGRYVRLAEFCAANELPDPYQGQFSDAQVDR